MEYNVPVKFNSNSFFNSSTDKKSNSSSFLSQDNDASLSLNEALKDVKLNQRRTESETRKLIREFQKFRVEISKNISDMEGNSKFEDLALFKRLLFDTLKEEAKMTMDLNKVKVESFKTVREEKKLTLDTYKTIWGGTGGPNAEATQAVGVDPNSALAIANNASSGFNTSLLGGGELRTPLSTDSIRKPVDYYNTGREEVKEADIIQSPQPANNTTEDFKPPVSDTNFNKPTATVEPQPVLKPEVVGASNMTVAQAEQLIGVSGLSETEGNSALSFGLENKNAKVIIDEIANLGNKRIEDIMSGGLKGSMEEHVMSIGANYDRSLKVFRAQEASLNTKMFVNVVDGSYYIKAFYVDKPEEEYTDFPYWSIIHIGKIKFEPRLKRVGLEFADESIPYVLINDQNKDTYPEFYKNEWTNRKTDKFRLSEETLDLLVLQNVK